MRKFAVIDTETTWGDEVMSIGVVVAEAGRFEALDRRYYVLTPQKDYGGMFSHALYINGCRPNFEGVRETALEQLQMFLALHSVSAMFAYNAAFDYRHLLELAYLPWYDIMQLAAYRQHNPKIPCEADCWKTGRLKRGYGVESIFRLLNDAQAYCETHNALFDALDELEIMRLLRHAPENYRQL